jgi:hypothetical protein
MDAVLQLGGLEEAIFGAVERALTAHQESTPWLSVEGAGVYLSMTPHAVRDAVAKSALPCHRTPTGRLRFRARELDAWVLGEVAA